MHSDWPILEHYLSWCIDHWVNKVSCKIMAILYSLGLISLVTSFQSAKSQDTYASKTKGKQQVS